jgi:hypothetical protein
MPNNLPLAIAIADAAGDPLDSTQSDQSRAEDIAARHPEADADTATVADAIREVRAAAMSAQG